MNSEGLMPLTLAEVQKEHAAYIETLLRHRAAARDLDDLVQLSFIEISRGLPRYDPSRPIKPWIATIVFRTHQRYVRRDVLRIRSEQRFSRDPDDHDPGCERRVEARDLVPQLLACLKERELRMVLRRLRDEEPIDVISWELGISADSGYKVLQTALEKLQDAERRLEAIERRQLSAARPRRALRRPIGRAAVPDGCRDDERGASSPPPPPR